MSKNHLLSLKEACAIDPPVSRQALYVAFKQGRLKAVRRGRLIFVTREDFDAYRKMRYSRLGRKINGQLIFDPAKGLYSVSQTAIILSAAWGMKVSDQRVYYIIRTGYLKATKAAGSYVVSDKSIREFMSNHEQWRSIQNEQEQKENA